MKKLIAVFISLLMILSMSALSASAVTLPNGGDINNCGYSTAEGRSSGGSDGYAYLTCTISGENAGWLGKDTVTAVTKSDVRSGLSAYLYVVAWYSDSDGGQTADNEGTSNTISDSGFKVTATAGNRNAYKGTAGHIVQFNTRGSWVCGTTYEF